MIIAKIKKLDGTLLDQGKFASEQDALDWFQPRIDKQVYGKKYSQAQVIPAVLGEDGSEIFAGYVIPEVQAEFTLEFSTYVKSQEEINEEALAYLASTDWMIIREMEGGTACSQSIKDLRAAARLSIVR